MSSRADVRNAIQTWLTAASIPNIVQIHTSFPKIFKYEDGATAGQITRAVLVIHIMRSSEQRIAWGGATNGVKMVTHTIALQIFCYSQQPKAEDAMNDFDTLVDTLVSRLRGGGHRLGLTDGTVIFQAAESQITIDFGEPKQLQGGATENEVHINFDVLQSVNA